MSCVGLVCVDLLNLQCKLVYVDLLNLQCKLVYVDLLNLQCKLVYVDLLNLQCKLVYVDLLNLQCKRNRITIYVYKPTGQLHRIEYNYTRISIGIKRNVQLWQLKALIEGGTRSNIQTTLALAGIFHFLMLESRYFNYMF